LIWLGKILLLYVELCLSVHTMDAGLQVQPWIGIFMGSAKVAILWIPLADLGLFFLPNFWNDHFFENQP
jgi:hypothetical protein